MWDKPEKFLKMTDREGKIKIVRPKSARNWSKFPAGLSLKISKNDGLRGQKSKTSKNPVLR